MPRIDASGSSRFYPILPDSDTFKLLNCDLRDVEFDLENDKMRCLKGLNSVEEYGVPSTTPAAVLRVTEIFDNPQFIIDGADAIDIIQGKLGDCWLLSALSTVSTSKGLIEKLCVEVSHLYFFNTRLVS